MTQYYNVYCDVAELSRESGPLVPKKCGQKVLLLVLAVLFETSIGIWYYHYFRKVLSYRIICGIDTGDECHVTKHLADADSTD